MDAFDIFFQDESDSLNHNYTRIDDPEDVPEVLRKLEGVERLAIDMETTGLDPNRSEVFGIALADAGNEWFVHGPAMGPMFEGLRDLHQNKNQLWIMHHAKFDLHFMVKWGIRPEKIFDTMVAQGLIDENQELALKTLARTKLAISAKLPDFKDLLGETRRALKMKNMKQVRIQDIPIGRLGVYAGRDARLTYDLWAVSEHELAREGMTDLFWNVEMPFLYLLLDMENSGFFLDFDAMDEVEKEFRGHMDEALRSWNAETGGINHNSTKQLAHYLYDVLKYPVTRLTDKEQPSTDAIALMRLAREEGQDGPVHLLQTIRKYEKLIHTYIDSFREKAIDGILYGEFNQTGTVTWRLSSSNPNLQNIPARGDTGSMVRKIFAARPGHVLVVIDYSQIELRLMAHYSKDPKMVQAFVQGIDLHQQTADAFRIDRKYAKNVNFGKIYGVGARGLADQIEKAGLPRPNEYDARDWLNMWDTEFPGAKKWSNAVIKYATQLGYVSTIDGHRRRLPDLRSRDLALQSTAQRQAVNSVIQGSAGSVIKYAMLNIVYKEKLLSQFDTRMLSQVHDELVFEAPIGAETEFSQKAQEIMESAEEHFKIRVPIKAEPGVGPNWADAKS